MKDVVSDLDNKIYKKIRNNINDFLDYNSKLLDSENIKVLDIAPQVHEGSKKYFKKCILLTADIDKNAPVDYHIDICQNNSDIIIDNYFNIVICTEVLEHTLNPFLAILELYRILKPGGTLLISTPFDFRIHGPLPDCWRFTEHALRELLKEFTSVQIIPLENKERFLMPYHYTTIAIK